MPQLDFPPSPTPGQTYNAPNNVIYTWDNTIGTGVWKASAGSPITITSPGSISGAPTVGSILSYLQGTYTGGVAPNVESWTWRKTSDNSIVQTNGLTLVIPPSLIGDNVYVRYTVTDSLGQVANSDTSDFPTPPATIQRTTFPLTTFSPSTGPNAAPASVNSGSLKGTAVGTWADGSVSLTSTGSLLFNKNGGAFSSGPTLVSNTDIIGLSWDPAAVAGAVDGATLSGCITDGVYENCYSLVVDRTPSAFAFGNLTNQALLTNIPSNVITPGGFNVPISFWQTTAGTTLTSNQVSVGGGGLVPIPTTLGAGVTVNPGDTLQVDGTTGNTVSTNYLLNLNLGSSTGTNATSTWDVQTTATLPSVSQPSIATPTAGSTSIATTISVTGTAYSSANGAGPHASSDWQIVRGDAIYASTSAVTRVIGPETWSNYYFSDTGWGGNGYGVNYAFNNVGASIVLGNMNPTGSPAGPQTQSPAQGANGGGTRGASFQPPAPGIPILSSDVLTTWVAAQAGTGISQVLGGTATNSECCGCIPPALTITGVSGTIQGAGSPWFTQMNSPGCGGANLYVWGFGINGSRLVDGVANIHFTDNTSFASYSVGNTLVQNTTGATGTIVAINSANAILQVTVSSGTFTTGNTCYVTQSVTYPPAPTSFPPGAGYTTVVNVAGDTTNLTSYPLTGLTAASRYYARVQYNSATIPTSSGFSAWSDFTTA